MPNMGMQYTGECNGNFYIVRATPGASEDHWAMELWLYDQDAVLIGGEPAGRTGARYESIEAAKKAGIKMAESVLGNAARSRVPPLPAVRRPAVANQAGRAAQA